MCYCSLLEGLWFVAERIGVRSREDWSSLGNGLWFVGLENLIGMYPCHCGLWPGRAIGRDVARYVSTIIYNAFGAYMAFHQLGSSCNHFANQAKIVACQRMRLP